MEADPPISRNAERCTVLGIKARPGRNAALMFLAADLSPAILSPLLNVNVQRAAQWSEAAGNSYNDYAKWRRDASA